jgi:hypothetical protein
MDIRLGYIKRTELGNEFVFIENLSQEKYNDIKNANENVGQIRDHRYLFKIVEENYLALNNFVNDALEKLIEDFDTITDSSTVHRNNIYLNFNRHLLNYLSSLRTFIDHAKTNFSKRYGSNSLELEKLNSILNTNYENSFAYRFLYKLRNYSQHCGLPVEDIYFSFENDINTKKTSGDLELNFNRDLLLHKYDSWGKVKKDLTETSNLFKVIPLIKEIMQILTDTSIEIEGIIRNSIKNSIELIENILNKHKIGDNKICIFYDIKKRETSKGLILNIEEINFYNTE